MSKDVELFGLHYEKGGFEALALSVNSGYIATNTSMKPDADNEFVLAAFDTGGKGYVAVGTVLSTIEGSVAITIADNILYLMQIILNVSRIQKLFMYHGKRM